jgi:hypothetical protein
MDSDMAKHAVGHVGHGERMPLPHPIPVPVIPDIADHFRPFHLESKTVFDGDDYNALDPSFDIDGAAARVVTAYDRDGDGALQLHDLAKLLQSGETSRIGRSIRELANAADVAGNGDGSATVEEIAAIIREFDQGDEGDGRLSGQERETFLAVFGEERTPIFRHLHPHPFPIRPLDLPRVPKAVEGVLLRASS